MSSTDLLHTTAEERELTRRAWSHLEVVHAVGIFGPEVVEAQRALGFDDQRSGYVAARVAPLGPVGPEVGTAVFHGFSPALLRRILPAVWELAAPHRVLEVTREAATRQLSRLAEGLEDEVRRAGELAREVTLAQPVEGRTLAAARHALAWPEGDPVARLWEAATRIRESRGDGHVACLVAAGLTGVQAHLTVAGDTPEARRFLRDLRGWTEPEWQAAVERLRERGLLDDEGRLTEAGRALRGDLEDRTDALAAPAWRVIGDEATRQLVAALRPLVRRILDAEILPMPVFRDRVVDPRGPESPELHRD